jgi:hypothetical protein
MSKPATASFSDLIRKGPIMIGWRVHKIAKSPFDNSAEREVFRGIGINDSPVLVIRLVVVLLIVGG